jgi:hypothetical protein
MNTTIFLNQRRFPISIKDITEIHHSGVYQAGKEKLRKERVKPFQPLQHRKQQA